jgi:hypothetical protein
MLAPYWAARILHGAANGLATPAEITLSWAMMLLFSVLYLSFSGWMFKKMLYRARVDATLGLQ